MGSFCPRISVFIPSMQEMPVWMKSLGYVRASGLMGTPLTSSRSELQESGYPSMGFPSPSKTRPSMSRETRRSMGLPVNSTAEVSVESPVFEPKICTATAASEISMMRPARSPRPRS